MTTLPLTWSFADPASAGVWVLGLALLTVLLALRATRVQPVPIAEEGSR